MWRRSVVEDRQVEVAEALTVAEPVHFDDPSAPYRECSDREGLAVPGHDHSHRAVDERRLPDELDRRMGRGLAGDRGYSPDLSRSACAEVLSEDDIGVEKRDQSFEVPVARSHEEGVDDL